MLVFAASMPIDLWSQNEKTLIISKSDDDPSVWQNIELQVDSQLIRVAVDSVRNAWLEEGYLTTVIDSIHYQETTDQTIAYLFRGYKYDEFALRTDEEARQYLELAGLHRVAWIKDQYEHTRVLEIMDKLVQYLENNAYPFAKVALDSVQTDSNEISARLMVDKSRYVAFDTLDIVGDIGLSQSFLARYLDILPDAPYSKKKVLATKKKLNDLPYAQLKSDPKIRFVNGKAILELELNKKQASVFDFIIGVLPNNESGQRKFTITGEFTGELYNELKYGERIYLKYQRLRPETQELDLKFNMPYIGPWPFGVDASFGLYRNSNDFLELKSKLGTQYMISGLNYIDISWYFSSSRLVEIDTQALINSSRLPKQLDVNYTGGGVGVGIQNLDYRYNPTKGYSLSANATAGLKSIIPNETIRAISENGVNFKNAYDTIKAKTFQTELHADASYFMRMGRWGTVKTQVRAAWKYNQEALYENEYFRIGGNKLMRGFDEQSIWGDYYAVATAELRVLLDQNSYLSFPFIDYGYVHSLREGSLSAEHLWGAGIGLNFGTPAGLFNVSFALGRREGVPVDLNAAKIHFGYVSLF